MQISARITIAEDELQESFVTAPGPGGQHVNRSATATLLRFDLNANTTLPEDVKQRLRALAANRISSDGVLLIQAHRYRSQHQNRQDARLRLIALIQRALKPPKQRRATRPTLASKQRRVTTKKQRGQTKQNRQKPTAD